MTATAERWEILNSSSSSGAALSTTSGRIGHEPSPSSLDGDEAGAFDLSMYADRAEDIARLLRKMQRLTVPEADRRLHELLEAEGHASFPLLYLAMTPSFRNDVRASAAHLFTRSLYPRSEPVDRRQTEVALDSRAEDLLRHVLRETPPLVRLGILEAFDDVNDFRAIRTFFGAEENARVRQYADEILSEEE